MPGQIPVATRQFSDYIPWPDLTETAVQDAIPTESYGNSGVSTRPSRQVSGTGGSRFSVLCLCHVRPEPEHGDQSWVAEGGDPADACAGDGEHADSVRLVVPVLVTGVGRCGRLPVGAGGQHAPVTRRSQQLVAQERYAGLAAGEPGTQRRRL